MNVKKILCVGLLTCTLTTTPFDFWHLGSTCFSLVQKVGEKLLKTMYMNPGKTCLYTLAGALVTTLYKRNAILRYACRHNNKDLVDFALSLGANPELKDAKGRIALHIAADSSAREASEILIISGFDVKNTTNLDQTDAQGMTPLMLAARNGSKDLVLLYIHHMCRHSPQALATTTPTNKTALTLALENGHADVASIILNTCHRELNEDVATLILSMPDNTQMTPLMHAAQHNFPVIIRQLLSANIDPSATLTVEKDGKKVEKTALVLASEQGHDLAVQALIQYCSKKSLDTLHIEQAIEHASTSDLAEYIASLRKQREQEEAPAPSPSLKLDYDRNGPQVPYFPCAEICSLPGKKEKYFLPTHK